LSPEVCLTNLGPRQVRRRLVPGLVILFVGLAAAVAAVLLRLPVGQRLVVLVPLGLGFLNVVQARAKT
jgi:hypothetical protein